MKSLKELARQLRQAVTQTRQLSHGLSPVSLEADGLMNALRELAESTRTLARIECDFTCHPAVLIPDAHVATHLYRIAQEAVNNALKHSHARGIHVSLEDTGELLTLTVRDNGRGAAKAPAHGSGMGLRVMKYRADLIGAKLDVESSPRRGTCVTCAVRKPA